jgi:hypothetical protein
MALLSRGEIEAGLTRLGELADERGIRIELLAVGGAALVLGFNARESTHDVDALIVAPREAEMVRRLVEIVASERDWPEDWLNDGAKGYLHGMSFGPTVLQSRGIIVRIPSLMQLLAMKLCAWRGERDIADAITLLHQIDGTHDDIWSAVKKYLVPGRELKARYAFEDLWESEYGEDLSA